MSQRASVPTIVKKPWGQTRCLCYGEVFEAWHASIEKGGYSSRHVHHMKYNEFYVVSGDLLVHSYADKDDVVPETTVRLIAGRRLTIPPGRWHKFEAVTAVELLEIYRGVACSSDIERADKGGCNDGDA